MYKVSVIIPVYGVEKYIERCARSLFEQTLDDIEYIFVNDCTPDNSIKILQNVLHDYPHRINQVKIINHDKNLGLPQARKTGILQANGKYLIHCDSDDWVEKDAYKLMWEKAKEKDYDIVFCDIYHSNGTIHKHQHRNFGKLDKETILLYIIRKVLWSVWGAMVKTSIFKNNIFYYPNKNNFEDLVLMVQMIHYSNTFAHIPKPLYFYYENANSMSKIINVNSVFKRLEEVSYNTEFVINYLKSTHCNNLNDISLILKLKCRFMLSKMTVNKIYYKKWKSIYPEIDNTSFILNPNIPISYKIHYWSVRFKIFKTLKAVQNYIRKVIKH